MSRRSNVRIFPVSGLHYQKSNNTLNLRPEYQRNAIWSPYNKQLLIDSILLDIPIPPVYFREVSDSNGYECVDGQQRLTTLFEFLNNEFQVGPETDPESLRGKVFRELPRDIQQKILNYQITAYLLEDWTDEEIRDMFGRLQEGSPLKAPEKRRAISGECAGVIKRLSNNSIFAIVNFDNRRYGHEDAITKSIVQLFHNPSNYGASYSSVSAPSLRKFYETQNTLSDTNTHVKAIKKAMTLIAKGFNDIDINPALKKWSFLTLTNIAAQLLVKYKLEDCKSQFCQAFIDFEEMRQINNDIENIEDQDPKIVRFNDACRNDQPDSMEYRHNYLRKYIMTSVIDLEQRNLDPQRNFTEAQRLAIWNRGDKKCAVCSTEVEQDNWDADHITPHSRNGRTVVSNGRVLCVSCNRSNLHN